MLFLIGEPKLMMGQRPVGVTDGGDVVLHCGTKVVDELLLPIAKLVSMVGG